MNVDEIIITRTTGVFVAYFVGKHIYLHCLECLDGFITMLVNCRD